MNINWALILPILSEAEEFEESHAGNGIAVVGTAAVIAVVLIIVACSAFIIFVVCYFIRQLIKKKKKADSKQSLKSEEQ